MLFFMPFTVCAFLALILTAANGGNTTPLSIPRPCKLDGVCVALETLSRGQERLEKTMKSCTESKKMVEFIILVSYKPKNSLSQEKSIPLTQTL